MSAIGMLDNELNKPHWKEAWEDAVNAPEFI
jgi:hypothetical protein